MPDLDSEALDFRAASELFTPVRTLRRSDLETLRLLARHQGHTVPTVGGVLRSVKSENGIFRTHGYRRAASQVGLGVRSIIEAHLTP